MSLREEQCNKVCRILDDVLANRPTERDSLIVATREAFKALAEPEIVYCRYCEHADFVKMGLWCCKGGGGLVSPDFFCGHGKRGER